MTTGNINGRRRGAMSIVVAMLLIILVGVTAIAIDGGMLQDNRRRVQAAADAAALAAAAKLFQNYPTIVATNTPDPSGQAATAALAVAASNGFPNSGASNVTVNIPPANGPFAGKLGYAEVIIVYAQPRYFSTVFGSGDMPVPARSVAIGKWAGSGNGVIVLDPTVAHALDSNGGGSLTVTGGAAMVVNSNDPEAAARTSGGGSLTASKFRVTGGIEGTFNGSVTTGVPPTPDPLAYLPLPTVTRNGTVTQTNLGNGNKRYTLTPGRHSNLPSFQSGDEVVFKQASSNDQGGIFQIDGGFSSQGATISMDPNTSGGMMIYNAPSSGANSQGVNITGNSSGSVAMSALTSGPYAGILLFQNRTATQTMSVAGNGSFDLTGTFYAANALLNVTGNGTATIGSQYISRTLNLGGSGNIRINYSEDGTARTRDIFLVE